MSLLGLAWAVDPLVVAVGTLVVATELGLGTEDDSGTEVGLGIEDDSGVGWTIADGDDLMVVALTNCSEDDLGCD